MVQYLSTDHKIKGSNPATTAEPGREEGKKLNTQECVYNKLEY
jgi:hypothetical protein